MVVVCCWVVPVFLSVVEVASEAAEVAAPAVLVVDVPADGVGVGVGVVAHSPYAEPP